MPSLLLNVVLGNYVEPIYGTFVYIAIFIMGKAHMLKLSCNVNDDLGAVKKYSKKELSTATGDGQTHPIAAKTPSPLCERPLYAIITT